MRRVTVEGGPNERRSILSEKAVVELLLRVLDRLGGDAEILQPSTFGHLLPWEAADLDVTAVGQSPMWFSQ